MATKKNTPLTVETLKHDDATRKNIPTAEYQSVMAKDEQKPVRVEYERRNRDLERCSASTLIHRMASNSIATFSGARRAET